MRVLPLPVDSGVVGVPMLQDFLHIYDTLEREFSSILVLTISSHILPVAQAAQQAALQHGGKAKISILDSQQTGPGLGMLTQIGAQAISAGVTLKGLEEHLRAAITSIYTLIHIHQPHAACNTDDDSSLLPLMTLEDGQFVPYKKIRTRRHLLETFQEFIEEFETPKQIACLYGRESAIRPRSLREIASENFPSVPFSEMSIPAPLARHFGPETIGVTIMEQ